MLSARGSSGNVESAVHNGRRKNFGGRTAEKADQKNTAVFRGCSLPDHFYDYTGEFHLNG